MYVVIKTISSKRFGIFVIGVAALIYTIQLLFAAETRQKFREWSEQHAWETSSTRIYKEYLVRAAQIGCGIETSSDEYCPYSSAADPDHGYPQRLKRKLLANMSSENISFQKVGLTLAQIDVLAERARIVIIDQFLHELRSKKDNLLPEDLAKLETICYEVFVSRTELSGKPTVAELQAMELAARGILTDCVEQKH